MSEKKIRTYKCPNCGADLRYDPKRQKIVCDYCDAVFNAEDYDSYTGKWKGSDNFTDVNAQEGEARPENARKEPEDHAAFWQNPIDEDDDLDTMNEFTCSQCGAKLYSTDQTIATFCSYCGSSVVLEKRVVKGKKPNWIIPFSVSKEDCEKRYRSMVRRSVFAPSYLKKETEIEKFRGIYMPYWVYTLDHEGTFSTRGEVSHRSGDYIITQHYVISASSHAHYDGVSYDSSSSFSDHLSSAIAPFNVTDRKEYNASYISGFYADAGDVSSTTYRKQATEAVQSEIAERLYAKSSVYRTHGVTADKIRDSYRLSSDCKKALYPVWFLSVRNKKGDRISYAVVNGQTGKTAADLPIDFKKYLLGSLALAVPVFLLLCFGLTLTPTGMLIAAAILAAVSLLIAVIQINKAYVRENGLDDPGILDAGRETGGNVKEKRTQKQKNQITGIIYVVLGVAAVLLFSLTEWLAHSSGIDLTLLVPVAAAAFILYKIISASKAAKTSKKSLAEQITAKRAPFSAKKWVWIKAGISVLICAAVLILHPVDDIYYYGAAVLSMVPTVWNFYDVIKAYNEYTTRPLPQFDVRGGDSNAPV